MSTDSDIAAMRADIARLQEQFRAIPSRWGGARLVTFLFMGAGNTIGTYGTAVIKGLKNNVTAISAVPTLAAAPGSADGLSIAYMGELSSPVWCAGRLTPDGATTPLVGMQGSIPEGTVMAAIGPYPVPITGGGGDVAPVYLIVRL